MGTSSLPEPTISGSSAMYTEGKTASTRKHLALSTGGITDSECANTQCFIRTIVNSLISNLSTEINVQMENTKHSQDDGDTKAGTEILEVKQNASELKRPDLGSPDSKACEAYSTDNDKGQDHPEKGTDVEKNFERKRTSSLLHKTDWNWFDDGEFSALEERLNWYTYYSSRTNTTEFSDDCARRDYSDCTNEMQTLQDDYGSIFVFVDVKKVYPCLDSVRPSNCSRRANEFMSCFINPKSHGDNHAYISVCCMGMSKKRTVELIELYKSKDEEEIVNLHELPQSQEELRLSIQLTRVSIVDGVQRHKALCNDRIWRAMKDYHPIKVRFYFKRDGSPMTNADALHIGLVLNGCNQCASPLSHIDKIHVLHSFYGSSRQLIFQLHSYGISRRTEDLRSILRK